ncbi:hypothetical protein FQA39_LY12082 [Lamprigera yunnana]|nr:hypothetical protein FQA39_LY12082 [Lamprigera yunnana]
MQLKLEENREARERRHKEEVEKKIRSKLETRSSLLSQMQEHKEQLRQQAKEDVIFKEQLVAQLAEDERLEQLSNEKKRQKLLQLRKDVEKMMQDRRQLYADNMQLNITLYEMEKKEENERTRVIQAERIKLLQEHATKLIGSLPKGILRKEDLPFLSSSVIEKCGGKLQASEDQDEK